MDSPSQLFALAALSRAAGGISSQVSATKQAESLREAGALAGRQRRRGGRRLAGRQRVAFAKGGVRRTGSVLDVAADTRRSEELAALREEFRFTSAAFETEQRGLQQLAAGLLGGGLTALTPRAGFQFQSSDRVRARPVASVGDR